MNQLRTTIADAQTLFVVFGAMILVSFLTGLNPTSTLLGAGLGTLLFQLVTKRKVPIFLGSSFASIAPIIYSIGEWGLPSTVFGLFATNFMYFAFAALIRWRSLDAVHKLLPPVIVGPAVMVIGLFVAAATNNVAMGRSGGRQVIDYIDSLILFGFTFMITVIASAFDSRVMRLILILIGVVSGCVLVLVMGLIDTGIIINAPWFAVPHFKTSQVNWQAALFTLPVATAPAVEHIGDIMAVGNAAGKNYIKDPGLDRTLTGDGLGVCVADLIGGPPVVIYGEVTDAVMITKNSNSVVMTWAAILAIYMAFFGRFNAFLASIPMPVTGGVILLLFGAIASLGIKTLIDAKVDSVQPKDLVIVSSVLATSIGGMIIKVGTSNFADVGLCAVLAIILNCVSSNTKSEEI